VLGSSEFSTPARTVAQVPSQVFGQANYGVRLMLVGEAFDQCLWDTMAVGALARGGLPGGKLAIIGGLGQCTDGGLDNASFGERFSYTLYRDFCANPQVSDEQRAYVRRRLLEQGIDETTVRAGAREDLLGTVDDVVLAGMDDLRLRQQLADVRARGVELAAGPVEMPDWEALRAAALEEAQARSTNNDWGLEDEFYRTQLEPALDRLAGARAGETYTDTPEYDDLDCLLDVCASCGVEPLVIVQPSCGPYYDHIGIDAQTRAQAYQRIRDVVAAHPSARLADFSDREYEPYFLFDIVHFGWTGWIDAEQALYEFALEDADAARDEGVAAGADATAGVVEPAAVGEAQAGGA
jgi:D-alanine transfer protein